MSAVAPAAPGRLGEQLDPTQLLGYLTELQAWLAARRAELDELDAAVQASQNAAELTADIRLGLTLWQTLRTRTDALLRTWDSGRVGPVEREQLSRLIWGRLDAPGAPAGAAPAGLSVPEACTLSDALTAQLRQRLQIDPAGSQAATRLRDLRAQVERLRDQVGLEPPENRDAAARRVAQLAGRVDAVAAKASRGGDVGGLLGPLELDAATFERDLIVGGAIRRRNAGRVAEVTAHRRVLAAREPALRELVARAVAAVAPAPKYAVPDVANLGPVPAAEAELDAYAARLDQVGRAMDVVEGAYAAALAEGEALRAELAGLHAGAPGDPALDALVAAAAALLQRTPIPVDAARSLLAGARAYAATRDAGRPDAGGGVR